MNQILVSEKIYVTPELKRKKRFYKIQFVVSLIAIIALCIYAFGEEYEQRKAESISQDILEKMEADNTVVNENTLVIGLSENVEVVQPEPLEKFNVVYTTKKGTKYKVDSILNIPCLGIKYPVISETNDELLQISLNKFWGGEPNAVGNYCIVGHNYDGKDIMFGKLHKLQNGDVVELEDKTGKVLKYKVYNTFIVEPTDVACTSQLTNGRKEMTLITCADGGKTRLIVKCRAVE